MDERPNPDPGSCGSCRLFVRDLVLDARIGIHPHEHGRTQRVRINLDLIVDPPAGPAGPVRDNIADVVSYELLVEAARRRVAEGHINLVETLAERLAQDCMSHRRVRRARVCVEKLDVYNDAGSVGVEIEHSRGGSAT